MTIQEFLDFVKPSWHDEGTQDVVEFVYTNYKGETARRRARFFSVAWTHTSLHLDTQWIADAFDEDRQRSRSFAVKDMRRIKEGE